MIAQQPYLTHAAAKALIDAAQDRAAALGQRISIAIIDNHGNLKAFLKMDNASHGSGEIARQKAHTSASLPYSTRLMGERNAAMDTAPFSGGAIGGAVMLPGGLPIFSEAGWHVGGIGVSGAAPDVDEELAEWALAAVRPQPKP